MAYHPEKRLLRNKETGVIVHYTDALAIMPVMEVVGEEGAEEGEDQGEQESSQEPAGGAVLDEDALDEINERINATTSVEEVRQIGTDSLAIPASEFEGKKIRQVRAVIRKYIKDARESIEAAE